MRLARANRIVVACGIILLALTVSNSSAQLLPPLSPPFPAIAPTLNPSDPANNLNACTGSDCTRGKFTEPFEEPTITYTDSTGTHTVTTEQKCLQDADGVYRCKPAAGTIVMLPDGNFLYWDALEGTENVELSIVAEYGTVSDNDQTRVLRLSPSGNIVTPSWARPSPVDGGANPNGSTGTPLLPEGLLSTAGTQTNNEGALFCSDQVELPDGLIMAAGGTDYYSEPGINGIPFGVAELEGLKNARLFDWRNLNWTQTGSMNWGRWYPSLVSLPNGNVFVASGVTKLLKPVYPQAPIQSGTNVVQTETFDWQSGVWTDNGPNAQQSLPLYPRLHLLPNGDVFYDAGGQTFNPFGQSYNEALWNIVSAYDPSTQTWTDLGYAGLPLQLNQVGLQSLSSALLASNPNFPVLTATTITAVLSTLVGQPISSSAQLASLLGAIVGPGGADTILGSGFRGTTFSVMLPLKPDASGNYSKAEFLTAGGVLSAVLDTSPGTLVATPLSRIDTVQIGSGGAMSYSSRLTGSLNYPRWFSYSVVLADGTVQIFNGANRDDVLAPGLSNPIQVSERFDPNTEKWTTMATSHQARTYHNTALLMPDGRVMIAGHAPISTAYLSNINLASLGFSPNEGRDPSFEIYSPPYIFQSRPQITSAPPTATLGTSISVSSPTASAISAALLVRRTATTHVVDGDQRSVYLPITGVSGSQITLSIPSNPAVVTPGEYLLFLEKSDGHGGQIPSISAPIQVSGP
ncbi:MAG TPA: galactose oxidase early set domain-containing protein [Candidatus Acidoferrum sp.]|nr:galactose oxidase early set domain-containing protein [Candidatus Acidoferrum sp.]